MGKGKGWGKGKDVCVKMGLFVGIFVIFSAFFMVPQGFAQAQSSDVLSLEVIDQLIETYGPVIRFHSEESYFPDDIESVLNDSRLEWALVEQEVVVKEPFSQRDAEWAAHSVTVLDSVETSSETFMDDIEEYALADPNSNDDRFRYYPLFSDKSGNLDRAKSLVRVRPWGSSHTDIQFYIFYPFNGPARLGVMLLGFDMRDEGVELTQIGSHWGDWEAVVLRFSNNPVELRWVGLSQHGHLAWFKPEDLTPPGDTHPTVFAAKHSHANYPDEGGHEFNTVVGAEDVWGIQILIYKIWAVDRTNFGQEWRTFDEGNYRIISSAVPDHDVAEPSWLDFWGRWGPPLKSRDFLFAAYMSPGDPLPHIHFDPDPGSWIDPHVSIRSIDHREVGLAAYGANGPDGQYWWSPPAITISPDPAYTDNDLTTTVTGWYLDTEKGQYDSFQWQKWDGTSWQDIVDATKNALDSSNIAYNDRIKVIVYPYDETNTIGAISHSICVLTDRAHTRTDAHSRIRLKVLPR